MPKTTSISPHEGTGSSTVSGNFTGEGGSFGGGGASAEWGTTPTGGYTAVSPKKNTKKSGAGSLNSQSTITGKPTAITSGATSNLGVKAGIASNPLNTLASRFNKEVDEVTLASSYYPTDQPLLARMIIQFPSTIDDTYTTALTGKGIAGKVATAPTIGGKQSSLLASPTNSFNLGSASSVFSGATGSSTFAGVTQEAVTSVASNPVFGDVLKSDDFLEVRPNNLLGFDFERKMNGVGQFTLTLFDPQWDRIEKKIIANRGLFKFKYGYSDGTPASFSPWYLARAWNYKLDYSMEGTTITLYGSTTGYVLALSKGFDVSGIDGKNISDTVRKIAEDLGWSHVVEDTKPVKGRDGIETTDLINQITSRSAASRMTFILNDLRKYAINKEGQGNYLFFIHTKPDGSVVLHFHTPLYDEKLNAAANAATSKGSAVGGSTSGIAQAAGAQLSVGAAVSTGAGLKTVPGFTMFRNKNSALIRFTPTWNMSYVQVAGGGGTVSSGIDMTTKDLVVVNLDMDTNPQQFAGRGRNIVKIPLDDYISKEEQDKEKLKAFKFKSSPDRNSEQIKAVAQADYSKLYIGAASAQLEVFGTPNFYLFQKIAVFVFKPQGDNTYANVDNIHWISGFFWISRIVESIRAGKYVTTFDLVTEGRSSVAPDPVNSVSAEK